MKFYNNIKTPTLIVHSDQDYRCWLSEALQLFTSLKHNDVDSKLVIFKNENLNWPVAEDLIIELKI